MICVVWPEYVDFAIVMNEVMIAWKQHHIDGLVQERRNSSALAMELRLSCTNPSVYRWREETTS